MELNELKQIIETLPTGTVLHTTRNRVEYSLQEIGISRQQDAIKYFIPKRNGNGNNIKRVIIYELLLYINEFINTGQQPNSLWINNNLIYAVKDGSCNIIVIKKIAENITNNHI